MGISPITELNNMLNMQNVAKTGSDNSVNKDAQNFQNTMSAITNAGYNNVTNAAVQNVASGQNYSSTNAYANTSMSSKVSSADKSNNLNNKLNKQTNAAERKSDDKLKNKLLSNDKAAGNEAEDRIAEETAEKLGISKEELYDILNELGLSVSDLLTSDNVSTLVTDVMADGDITALVTDESMLNLVQDLNETISGILEQVAETSGIDKDALVDIMEQMSNSFDGELDNALEGALDESALDVTGENNIATNADTTENANNSGAQSNSEDGSMQNQQNMDHSEAVSSTFVTNTVENTSEAAFESEMPLGPAVDPREILEQMTHHIRSRVTPQMTQLQMQLNPENLGTVGLTVSMKEGNMTAQFTAQSEEVKAALESQIAILKENLEEQGVKIEAVEVTVSSHAFERNLEQGNDSNRQQEEEQERLRKATRKIDLSGVLGGEEGMEDIAPEEAVTVSMMQADGNRMDYKV